MSNHGLMAKDTKLNVSYSEHCFDVLKRLLVI